MLPRRDLENEIIRAMAQLRARDTGPAKLPGPHPQRAWIASHVAAAVLGVAIGATALLASIDEALMLSLAIVASKYAAEAGRVVAFASIGLVAGLAKALQSYADGQRHSALTIMALLAIAMIFAAIGGVAADAVGLDRKLGLVAAFVSGVLGFGSIRLLEERIKK